MKKMRLTLAVFALVLLAVLVACNSAPPVRIVELDNKGNAIGSPKTPEWITTYITSGVSALQAEPQYEDKYCIVGEETGVNKQFVLAWADNFSAQQRIGAMLRTNIATEYQARVEGSASSTGGAGSIAAQGMASGEYNQEIENVINAVVNVSYSGAQRENDWWTLRRRYDPDVEGVFADEFTAYVLYTIPKASLNEQIARSLATSVEADSALYAVTQEMAQQILVNGLAEWLETDTVNNANASETPPRRR